MTDDPKTTDQIFEQQQITCLAYGGSFQLRFRRKASNIIPFLSSLEELKDILESTPSYVLHEYRGELLELAWIRLG